MLLTQPFFKTFTKRDVCDTSQYTEGLLALSCETREEVDEMVNRAIGAGGQRAMDPQDHGFSTAGASTTSMVATGRSSGWIPRRRSSGMAVG